MSRSKLNQKERRVEEKITARYKVILSDEAGAVIPLSDMTTITLTLYDDYTGTIINSRNAQNVKNTNNVTYTEAGLLTWTLQPNDNIIVSSDVRTNSYEKHIALFEFTWDSGAKAGKHELEFQVRQINKVT
tara:strand:+ start:1235 stop:1627 length:393 start_codon:yes stop_codon:yes gene_type:complete